MDEPVVGFGKRLHRAAGVVGGQAVLYAGEADAALGLDVVLRIGDAAIEAERVPGVPGVQAQLVGVDSRFAAWPGLDFGATGAGHQPHARALFQLMIETDQQARAAVRRACAAVIACQLAGLAGQQHPGATARRI